MKIERLHYISQEGERGESHAEMIRRACDNGVNWVQFRVKNKSGAELYDLALESLEICKDYKATFIVNDYVSLAKSINADGVHLGKNDTDIHEARKILGTNKIIGGTANDMETVSSLALNKVNYIGLGPFRFTETKQNLSPLLGLEGYREIINALPDDLPAIPIIAIGGIREKDLFDLMDTGVYGIALASQINFSSDPARIIEQTNKVLNYAELANSRS